MKNEFVDFWSEFFRWGITLLVFGLYTALTFFALDGDWSFLGRFSYWFDLLASTTLAWFLRYLWMFKGLNNALFNSQDIKEKEIGKGKVVEEINSNSLTDVLQTSIDVTNESNKLIQYRLKCDRKIRKYRGTKYFKGRLEYWKQERINCDKEEFDVNVVKVRYYKYDIDSMLSSTYRPNHDTETRGNINLELFKSFRISIITMIVFAVLGAINIWLKDYSNDDLIILGGKLLMFLINMYSGHDLGKKFVLSKYSNDLTKDYAFMKKVLKES